MDVGQPGPGDCSGRERDALPVGGPGGPRGKERPAGEDLGLAAAVRIDDREGGLVEPLLDERDLAAHRGTRRAPGRWSGGR